MDKVTGRIREGFTFIIELKTLQIHAESCGIARQAIVELQVLLRAHYKDIFSIW